MTDTIIKSTGNSRTLASVSNLLTLYPNYESFAAALASGTLPIDLGPLNAAGCDVIGTLLNKANLLPDSVESAIWGNAANRTVAQALQQLRSLITTAQNTANALNKTKAQAQVVSYTGTGTSGTSSDPVSITFSFAPKIIIYQIPQGNVNGTQRWYWLTDVWKTSFSEFTYFGMTGANSDRPSGKKSNDGKTFSWYSGTYSNGVVTEGTSNPTTVNNASGEVYRYVGIG